MLLEIALLEHKPHGIPYALSRSVTINEVDSLIVDEGWSMGDVR